jgi:hypothetical protein
MTWFLVAMAAIGIAAVLTVWALWHWMEGRGDD